VAFSRCPVWGGCGLPLRVGCVVGVFRRWGVASFPLWGVAFVQVRGAGGAKRTWLPLIFFPEVYSQSR